MTAQEKFDSSLIDLAPGYREKFSMEPEVIEHELADAKISEKGNIELSSSLSLIPTPRCGGFCVSRDNRVVNNLKDLTTAELKLIRGYLDNPYTGNELIPEMDD